MSLTHLKLNDQLVLVQYQTDPCDQDYIEVQKVFYHELDVAPILSTDVLEELADEIFEGFNKNGKNGEC